MALQIFSTVLTLLSVRQKMDAKFVNYNEDGTANEVFIMPHDKWVELGEPDALRIAVALDDESGREITLTPEGQFEDHAKLVDELRAIPEPDNSELN